MIGHIGILGCSAPGAALCFEIICRDAQAQLGEHAHPEVTLNVLPFVEHVTHVRAGDWAALARMLQRSAERLRRAGADFIICPDNTAHIAFTEAAAGVALPWLHIADGVADSAARHGYRRVAVLGTRALMASDVYPARLRAHDLSYAVPTAAEGEALDALIFGELSRGEVSPRGCALLADLTRRMQRDENCDAVVLGCTELPLLLDPQTPLALPALDSTRLLARAAIARALSSRV